MAKKSEKTNALRLLDKLKIPYEAHSYPCEEFTGGEDVARQLGLDPADVCKTLVTVGKSGGHFVFVLPVTGELDRKKAAALVGEKSLEMLHVKDLLAVTGYVRGGCTALGMKKQFPTVVEQSLREKPFIYVSGGKRGLQRCAGKRLKRAERSERKSFWSNFFQKVCEVWSRAPRP